MIVVVGEAPSLQAPHHPFSRSKASHSEGRSPDAGSASGYTKSDSSRLFGMRPSSSKRCRRVSRSPVHPVSDMLLRLAEHLVYGPARELDEISLLSRNGLHVSFVLQIGENFQGILFGSLA